MTKLHFIKHKIIYILALLIIYSVFAAGCSVKPNPYTEGQMLGIALTDKKAMLEGVPPLAEGNILSLQEAIVRALTFNFDARLALSENTVAEKERVLAALSMLPDLTASANVFSRSNENASSSQSYKTRQQSLEPSFSVDKERHFGDLKFSWSILDAGMSYYTAMQSADRVLITLERRRRTMNTIVKDVIGAYFKAKAAQQHLSQVTKLIIEAENAQKLYKKIEKENAEPLPVVLEKEKALLNLISQLKRIQGNLDQARIQLAILCNLPVHEHVKLSTPNLPLPKIDTPITELELIGLYMRPELREERYQERIDISRIRQEILRMFPGVTILGSFNWDTNSYLVNNTWFEAGMQASASLLRLAATGPAGKRAAEARQQTSQLRRLAISMATMVQINLGKQQYELSLHELAAANEMQILEKRLLKHVTAEADTEAGSKLALVQQKSQAFTAELLYDLAKVDAGLALSSLYYSIGVGFADNLPANTNIQQVADAVNLGLANWAVGTIPKLPQPEANTDLEAPKIYNDNSTVEERNKALRQAFPTIITTTDNGEGVPMKKTATDNVPVKKVSANK